MTPLQRDIHFVIVIPVFNDWQAFSQLVDVLDRELSTHYDRADILVVDDGSTEHVGKICSSATFRAIQSIHLLRLKRNLGHQRAIAVALAYLEANAQYQAVVVMDADGEDQASDVPRLIQEWQTRPDQVVFARRSKRSESLLFRLCYQFYKMLFIIFTGGPKIEFGNFSLIPFDILRRLVVVSEIWNHYSAGILKARIPYTSIDCDRGKRFYGESKMKFISLMLHGLSALSVFGDVVSVRILIVSLACVLFMLGLIVVVLYIRIFTEIWIWGWATYTVGLLVIGLLQAILLSSIFVFLVLGRRNSYGFILQRDYHYFVLDVTQVFPPS